MSTYDSDDRPRRKSDDERLLDLARKRFKLAYDAESKQRAREREDLLFQIPENQWDDDAKRERQGGGAGGAELPPRPILSISLIRQPLKLVKNQARKAKLGVNIDPANEDANDELAEVIQDLYRRIERDGQFDQARQWAFDRSVQCGRGWYRIITCYDEDTDPNGPAAWDQEIRAERILHQDMVYPDPSAQKADYSDGNFLFFAAWMTEEDFRLEFPDAELSDAESIDWEGLAEVTPEWVRPGNDKPLLVVEYWWKEKKREEVKAPKGRKPRYREKVTVHCTKIAAGDEILESYEWNGKYIPFIPVIGEELQPIDGERRWQGMTRPARDAQRAYNWTISTAIEDASRLSKAPYVGYAESFEGYEDEWRMSNVRNFPFLRANLSRDGTGAPLPLPQPMQIDGTKLQLSLALAEHAKQMVNSAIAVHEPSLGELPARKDAQSGRAILALQQQAEAGTSDFLLSVVDTTLPYEARVVLDLIPSIYDRAGRITRVLGGEDEPRTVMLNRPYVNDPTGKPRPVPRGTAGAKFYDLRNAGSYSIAATVGKSHQTRLEAGQAFLTELLGAYPQLMEFGGDIVMKFRDEPGARELADRMTKMIRSRFPQLFDNEQAGVEQMQAQLAAAQQQLQAMGEQFQQAVQALQTEQAKHQAQVAIAQMKEQASIEIARMNNAAKIQVARIQSQWDRENLAAEAAEERLSTGLKLAAEHEMKQEEMAHEVAMAAAGGQSMKMSRTQGANEEGEQGEEMSGGMGMGEGEPMEEGAP